ncbi:unnamed protein product, partial [Prorocentrum cordatum]
TPRSELRGFFTRGAITRDGVAHWVGVADGGVSQVRVDFHGYYKKCKRGAIRPIKACQKKAREKANSLLGLPMTKLSDSNLDASGLAENKSDGKGCHCRWLRGLSELSKAGRRTWKTNKWYLLRGFLLLVLGLVVIVLRLDMDRPSTLPRLMAQEPDADLLGRAGAGT